MKPKAGLPKALYNMVKEPTIAVDFDNVRVNTTEALRLVVNDWHQVIISYEAYFVPEAYQNYYEAVWARYDLERLSLSDVWLDLREDQSHVSPYIGVTEAVVKLKEQYQLIAITGRKPDLCNMVKHWLTEHFDER
jgi:FMN phosphatase YigB (HAD superfamily)